MFKNYLFLFLIISFSCLFAKHAKLNVFIDNEVKIYYDIHFDKLPDGEHSLNKQAEADFKHYFKEMTGKELPIEAFAQSIPLRAKIVTNLGLNERDSLLKVSESEILISAADTLGIVNALYSILDGWNCRWVMPGKLGEVIPKQKTLQLVFGEEKFTIAMNSKVHRRFAGEYSDWRRRNRRAAKEWQSAQHYWFYAIPPKDYFEKHPEYYSLIGGKRVPKQLCVSNPELRKLMLQKAKDFFRTRPYAVSFPMDPEDNFDHCQCDACRALDLTDQALSGYPSISNRVADFANFVARGIRDEFPDKKVGYYAYANKKSPPDIKLESNIFVPYTRDSSSLIHLMPDPKVPSSIEYWQLLEKWLKKCSDMYVYEYDPVSWTGSLYSPIYLQRAKAIKKQYEMGIQGIINDTNRADATLFMNKYMELRFKNNPRLNPEDELADVCNRFFGKAGKFMNRYYLELAKVTDCKEDVRFGIAGYDRIFSKKMVKRSSSFLKRAIKIADKEDDPAIKERLQMVQLAQNYLEAYMNFIWNLTKKNYELSCEDSEKIFTAINALGSADPNYIRVEDAKRRLTTAVKKNMAIVFSDEMKFIKNWQMLGLYDNSKCDGIIIAEPLIVKDNKFYIADQVQETRNYNSPEGFISFAAAHKENLDPEKLYYSYATTSVRTEIPRFVKILTDSFYPFKVWLNDKLVYVREGADADCPDKRQISVLLKAGENRITVMVANSSIANNRWGFWLRLAGTSGEILDPEKISAPVVENKTEIDAAVKQVQTLQLPNIVPHPSFENLSNLEASTFGVWPPAIRKNVELDKNHAFSGTTSVKFMNIAGGSLNRFFSVRAGERYLLGFKCLNKSEGVCYLTVSWRSKGVFMDASFNKSFYPGIQEEGWKDVRGLVTIPEGADQLVFSVSINGQGNTDECYVDELFLYKIP